MAIHDARRLRGDAPPPPPRRRVELRKIRYIRIIRRYQMASPFADTVMRAQAIRYMMPRASRPACGRDCRAPAAR